MNFLFKKFIKSNQRILTLTIAAVLILSGFLALNKINHSQDLVDIQIPLKYTESLVVTAFNHSLSIQPVNASTSAKAIRDRKNPNVVKYIDVFQNTDIVLTKHTAKLKEDIILKQPGHPQRFSYLINCNEYSVDKDTEGNIHFSPKNGKDPYLDKFFFIPAPFMIDAQGAQSSTKDVEMFIEDNVLILIPNPEWLKTHPYPIILDPTIEIHILNVHSHPQAGDDWAVSFTTKGAADLMIIPNDQATIDDLDFVSLKCGAETRAPQILENDVIFYPNWSCDEKAELIHLVNTAASHALEFQFGDQTKYAYNSPAVIRLKGNIRLKGGVRLAGVIQYNDIGAEGEQGFGLGACPPSDLPTGFSALAGSADKTSDDYGNYQFQDGSIMVYIPKFYYKVGTAEPNVNVIDVKSVYDYTTRAAAEADGYALHRVFIDGGAIKDGFFVDKYMASKTASGAGYTASSVQNGLPLSTALDHNPIMDLTACGSNNYYQTINAVHARDGVNGAINSNSIFQVASRFQYSAMAMLSMAHGQASSNTDNCAWWHATYNFPKGCNNNALGDINDLTISYVSDGYSNCGKTGSGTPFAKTTHNGQSSGVADLNGLMWEVTLGVTAITANDTIEDISRASPANVQETGHTKSTGDYVMITGIEGGDWAGLDDKIYVVTKVDANNYTLDGVDTSGFTLAYVQGTNHGTTTSGTFYLAKEATAMKNFTSGNSQATDHWGATGVAAMMDSFSPAFETGYASNGYSQKYGSGSNQVLSEDISGNDWLLSGLGFPKDKDGVDTTGTNLFGKDYFYQYMRNELCLLSCAGWNYYSLAGVWSVAWHNSRTHSRSNVGFRAACYPD